MFPCLTHPFTSPTHTSSTPGLFIILENPTAHYKPGETIIGEIQLINQKSKSLKYIQIQFSGKATVEWSKSQGLGSRPRRRYYTAKEVYFAQERILFQNADRTILTLPLGTHRFPFSYNLPTPIPSTFKHKFGTVEYSIKAVIKRPWYKPDVTETKPFKIQGQLDLNLEPGVNVPITGQKQTYICNHLCQWGKVGFVLTLPRRGFVPGEYISFRADITNNSKTKIKRPKVSLIAETSFIAGGAIKTESYVVRKVRGRNEINGERMITWSGDVLRIPPTLPTGLGGCGVIINLKYTLKFELKMPLFCKNIHCNGPITIGTIPLRSETVFNPIHATRTYHAYLNPQFDTTAESKETNSQCQNVNIPPAYIQQIEVMHLRPIRSERPQGIFQETDDEDDTETLPSSYEEAMKMQEHLI